MIGNMEQGSTSLSTSDCTVHGNYTLQPKHKVFLSHSGAQKGFVEQLCVDLERCDRHPFFDKCRDCLPIGKEFPRLIFEAIEQCEVGVVVLSEEFFTSKWPMLELVAMANVKKRKPSFTIMPILLGLTLSQCRDVANHKQWLSLWHTWSESDRRIDVRDCENALQLFGPTNALKYNLELGEVTFRVEIVEAICKLVPPRTRFEDSHVQGRSRLCKVVYERIKESNLSSAFGVQVVGLYGVGGIGKTTICKSLCNDVSQEYCGKVAHVELGSQSEEEMLKDVLRRLTNMRLEYLGATSVDELRHCLMRDLMNIKVFLAIDNVSSATSKQAYRLLQANYGPGSVLLVTARSVNELMSLRIDASECMEMLELEMEEARSIFLYHAACIPPTYYNNKDDCELVLSCIKRCHFKKGDGISSHYHPLALQAMGEQLRSTVYVPERWRSLLHEIDYLNPLEEPEQPVFSILRRSFDVLSSQDRLLFIDVAVFAPNFNFNSQPSSLKWNIFEWLGMVHERPVKRVIERLETLKRKSLLENLGDGFGRVGMHDLWREFAWLETKVRQCNALEEGNVTNGGRRVNLKRMFFFREGLMKVEDVNFDCFCNVRVLILKINLASIRKLDLRGLKHLKSLKLDYNEYIPVESRPLISLVGLGSLSKFGFLQCSIFPLSSHCIGEIAHLTNLQVLELYKCRWVLDLSRLIFLQVVCFDFSDSVLTIPGLSSKHTNLKFLDLSWCGKLRSCPGVGELVALQELCLNGCSKLIEVPNLQKLKQLQKLDVRWCRSLKGLPGLGGLVSLLELIADRCENLVELPNMCNLQNLRILDLSHCKCIKSLLGLNEMVCLQSLTTWECKNLTQLPDIHKLTNLQTLKLDPSAPVQASMGLSDLILLRRLHVRFNELYDEPDLCKLTKLETLVIFGWQSPRFSNLVELVSLKSFTVNNCKGVCVLPNLERLSRLHNLTFTKCNFEDLSGLINLANLEKLEITVCDKLDALPDLRELVNLRVLRVEHCVLLRDVRSILGLWNLEILALIGNPCLRENLLEDLHQLTSLKFLNLSDSGFADLQGLSTCSQLHGLTCERCPMKELPDLANFPNIQNLNVWNCVNLTKLICTGPLSQDFNHLEAWGCMRLQALPDLTNARKLDYLCVAYSGVVLSAPLIQDMEARWPSINLITQGTSSRRGCKVFSHRIWHRSLGMIPSLHCGCTRNTLGGTHPK